MIDYRAIIHYGDRIAFVEGKAINWSVFVGKARMYADIIFEYDKGEDNLYVQVTNISEPEYVWLGESK